MAATISHEVSSSISRCRYDVFLSFRGDTRKRFTDHLFAALKHAGFHTFRDEEEIERGKHIELEIREAIEESQLSIIVFSKNYASSRYCLNELVMILERRNNVEHKILPVFYDVDPSQVSEQTNEYAKAFAVHEVLLMHEMERVNGWKKVLREVADLGGMVLADRHEAEFIQDIIREARRKVILPPLYVPQYLVGIDFCIEDVSVWLLDGSKDANLAIIYGIGGVGKTTIAKIVYNQNIDKFQGKSFLANVRERSEQPNGLIHLQAQLLSDMLNTNSSDKIQCVDEGVMKIKQVICCKKVLIILDDVDKEEQFNATIRMRDWLCQGSKIIVTTRHKSLLSLDEECVKFRVQPLNDDKSFQLFGWHAFKQTQVNQEFAAFSNKIVKHCCGLPLALEVVGSSLFGKSIELWKGTLQQMKAIPLGEIQNVLKTIYDSLENDHHQDLFLDIACFFIGMDMDYVVKILSALDVDPTLGIQALKDRLLIEVDEENELFMHQLIRDMGREVARQQSHSCRRIWNHKEALTALSNKHLQKQEARTVRGLVLDMNMLVEEKLLRGNYGNRHQYNVISENLADRYHMNSCKRRRLFFSSEWRFDFLCLRQEPSIQVPDPSDLNVEALAKMNNLKYLQLNYIKLHGNCEYFPRMLIWLYWLGFPLKSIPEEFCFNNLVILDMRNSNLVDVWKGKVFLPELKVLDLSHSHYLLRTPDFLCLPSLERLILEDCIHLVQVHPNIGYLERLVLLNLKNCKNLKELPKEIGMLNSLEILLLEHCSKLDGLPLELGQLKSLKVLHIDKFVTSDDSEIKNMLWKVNFWSWFSPRTSSESITFPLSSSLVDLQLPNCNITESSIAKDLSCLSSLKYFNLTGNPICSLPESITRLPNLLVLWLNDCTRLQSLPKLPTSLQSLGVSRCYSLEGIVNLHTDHLYLGESWHLVDVQEALKQELISKIDLDMLVLLVNICMHKTIFEIILDEDGTFNIFFEGKSFQVFPLMTTSGWFKMRD